MSITAISAHAALLLPLCRLEPGAENAAQLAELEQGVSALALYPLATTIELTRAELQNAMQATISEQQESARHMGASPTKAAHLIQQALLLAALDKLMARLWQTPTEARSLVAQAKCKFLALLHRWQQRTHQRIVNATARWSQAQGSVVWDVTIGVPVK